MAFACSGESLCSRSNDNSSSESEYEFSSNPDYNKFEKCVKRNKLKYKEHLKIVLDNSKKSDVWKYLLKENPRLSLLSDFINNNRISNCNTDTDFEIKLYVNTKVNDYVDPIDWWKQNASTFKSLSLLAQFYFSVPASSASSEMAFSTAGGFSIAKRSSLNPAKLNQLCFIHDNFDIIQDKLMETV